MSEGYCGARPIPDEVIDRLSYNPETGDLIWIKLNKSHPRLLGKVAGCNRDGYRKIKIGGVAYSAHRVAWFIVTRKQPYLIDHINGDSLDNRFINLRECTQKENVRNRKIVDNKSGLPCGVRSLPSGKFRARVTCDGECHELGTFATKEEAGEVCKEARKVLFKQYVRSENENN